MQGVAATVKHSYNEKIKRLKQYKKYKELQEIQKH